MPESLTALERRVFHYLIDFLGDNTFQPSIREIARKFRIKSTKTVSDLLHALERKGYIERDASRSRGVRLLGYAGGGKTQPVPYYGRVHAGEPALPPEHRVGYLTADRRFLPTEDCFALKADGDSMTGRAILSGDFVICSPSLEPKDGDIVAARLGDRATIKTLTHRDGVVLLEPANPDDRAIEVSEGDDFAVLGVVCGVFRPFSEKPADATERDD
jgi:repressor LexA